MISEALLTASLILLLITVVLVALVCVMYASIIVVALYQYFKFDIDDEFD